MPPGTYAIEPAGRATDFAAAIPGKTAVYVNTKRAMKRDANMVYPTFYIHEWLMLQERLSHLASSTASPRVAGIWILGRVIVNYSEDRS